MGGTENTLVVKRHQISHAGKIILILVLLIMMIIIVGTAAASQSWVTESMEFYMSSLCPSIFFNC